MSLAELVAITKERNLLGVLRVAKILEHFEPVGDGFAVLLLDRWEELAAVAGLRRHDQMLEEQQATILRA